MLNHCLGAWTQFWAALISSSQHFYNISSLKEAHRRTRNLRLSRNFNENGKYPRLGVYPCILISLHLKGGLISNIELIKGTSRSSYKAKSNANSSLYWLLEEFIWSLAKTPILWPPDAKSWLIWKDPDAGKDWGQEEKGTTEDEMVGWHHQLNGHGFGWTLGVGDGQGGLACCGSWGLKESDWATELNWTEWKLAVYLKSVFIKLSSLENIEASGER